jgi:serine/threonine protein kinase
MERINHLPESEQEILRESIEQYLSFEKEEFFIDKGGVGEVFRLPGSNYCMKLIEDRHNSPNRHLFNLGNTPYQEMKFQERASQTNFAGKTRVPKIVAASKTRLRNQKFMLIMEQLPAVNLQHIINGNASLPDNTDIDDFFGDLESFLNHLHRIEKIVHNDFYARNIMIDTVTAQPYVIDFGRAIDTSKISNERTIHHLEDGDWERVDEVYKMISALQK